MDMNRFTKHLLYNLHEMMYKYVKIDNEQHKYE